jgi:hypothetical protein
MLDLKKIDSEITSFLENNNNQLDWLTKYRKRAKGNKSKSLIRRILHIGRIQKYRLRKTKQR